MCGRKDMREMRGSPYWPGFLESSALIPEWIVRPPFDRVYGNISGSRTSQFRPPRGLDRLLESIPPLRSIFIKLDLGISPPLLNRFSRFQRCCNLLIHTFPTVYNTTQFSKGITEEEQVNKNTANSGSRPPEQV